jgi:hypothetical protein
MHGRVRAIYAPLWSRGCSRRQARTAASPLAVRRQRVSPGAADGLAGERPEHEDGGTAGSSRPSRRARSSGREFRTGLRRCTIMCGRVLPKSGSTNGRPASTSRRASTFFSTLSCALYEHLLTRHRVSTASPPSTARTLGPVRRARSPVSVSGNAASRRADGARRSAVLSSVGSASPKSIAKLGDFSAISRQIGDFSELCAGYAQRRAVHTNLPPSPAALELLASERATELTGLPCARHLRSFLLRQRGMSRA